MPTVVENTIANGITKSDLKHPGRLEHYDHINKCKVYLLTYLHDF